MDFRYMETDDVRISKQAIKEKNLPWQLKAENIKMKCLKIDKWFSKAKWLTRRRQKIHSHKPFRSFST